MTENKVDENSVPYMFGVVLTKLDAIEKKVISQNGKVDHFSERMDEFREVVAKLPCNVHNERINDLEKWENNCNSDKRTEEQAGKSKNFNFWMVILASFLSASLALLVGLAISLI